MIGNSPKGDAEYSDLLFYLSDHIKGKNLTISSLKKKIWLLQIDEEYWIVKKFSSGQLLQNQVLLTEKLHQYSFINTYRFHPIHQESSLSSLLEKEGLGIFEYIQPHKKNVFHFTTKRKRKHALQLLEKYHHTVKHFTDEFQSRLQPFSQLAKWHSRLLEFIHYHSLMKGYMPNNYFQHYVMWAQWSLQELYQMEAYLHHLPLHVIHGDVVDHNFLLGANNRLYLIDFDLMRLAPKIIDYLQFANRILPHINWSLEELLKEDLPKEFESRFFLTALIFPTDILREWNRFIKGSNTYKQKVWHYLYDLTFSQFSYRKQFVDQIIRKLK